MKRVLAAGLIFLVLGIVGLCAGSYWVYSSVNTQHAHSHANDYIKIEKGSTPRQIIDQLAENGIIPSGTAALIYIRTLGDGSKLQAGEYQFPSPISTLQVLKQLEKGQDLTVKLTIPEGFTRFDIAKRIIERFPHDASLDDKAVLALMDDTSLIKDISPTATNLEGYMYPSTYSLPRDSKPQEIIKAMVEQFRKAWKPEYAQQAKTLGRTPHEIVTIASLIETETAVQSERPIVAGIINNRLAKNTPLGIDQTNVYIAKMLGRWDGIINKSDLEVDSPYNTRIKTGLPPGPISSVSESSLKAALYPQATDYLFYVRNVDANDGSHWFYSSAAEFEKGKAKYQQWLEQQRQEKRAEQTNANNAENQ
ncbi:MAG: endolytic transglycosylase MltG [Acidobacteria bacterium]|nr:endolytic transglycosylase MltG [Acidobacteriota bacterium]